MTISTDPGALPQPYLLFLGDVTEESYAKTAFGLRDWVPEQCVGEYALETCRVSTGLPRLTPSTARTRGAQSMVIGIASRGGTLAPAWIPAILEALEAGLDLISGMHQPLETVPEIAAAASRLGRRLINVRRPPTHLPVATGRKRRGQRLLTVGTDCALGKKYTALALARAFVARGLDAHFRATGQTGILIAGRGVPIDAVVADFVAGAAEMVSPDAALDAHWDVIEGQGALTHPSYAGVSLGLLLGSQPDVIVVCHDLARRTVLGLPDFAIPSVEETIALNLQMARRTNPAVRCGGVSINTSALDAESAEVTLAAASKRFGLTCADPIRGGAMFDRLVDDCLNAAVGSAAVARRSSVMWGK